MWENNILITFTILSKNAQNDYLITFTILSKNAQKMII